MITLCGCGCGGEPKEGNRYINGHNRRGKVGWNKNLTKETDERVKRNGENISKALIGRTKEEYDYIQRRAEAMKGDNNPMKHPEVVAKVKGDNAPSKRPEVRKKISETLIALWNSPNYRELHSGKNHPKCGKTKENDESIRRHSEIMTGRTKENDEGKRRQSEALRGRTKETHEGIRRGAERKSKTLRLLWKDPEHIEKMMKALHIKPNKPEKQLLKLLNELFSNEYVYNGDFSAGITINRKIPDFVNINGKKKLIELYGDYWHKDDNPQDRIDLFKQYGYETLVIWEHELEDMKLVVDKILEFNGS